MTEAFNTQDLFLSLTGRISGSFGLGVLQANPDLTSVWINYRSPYLSARYPQGSVGFSRPLGNAATTLLGEPGVVFSNLRLATPGTNYSQAQLKAFGENATRAYYRSQGYGHLFPRHDDSEELAAAERALLG